MTLPAPPPISPDDLLVSWLHESLRTPTDYVRTVLHRPDEHLSVRECGGYFIASSSRGVRGVSQERKEAVARCRSLSRGARPIRRP
jgi:hypothetical protein